MGDSLSAGDILAMTRGENGGFLEGNGIIILLLFLLFLGGGFGGFGNNNNASTQGALTRAEMQDGLNAQNTLNSFNSLNMSLANDFANLNLNMNNGFNGLAMGMNNGFNSVTSNIQQLGFNMQQCCCDLKTQIGIQGDLTRNLINQNTMQDLRDRLVAKDIDIQTEKFNASQFAQTSALESFILANKSSSSSSSTS